MNPAVRNYSRQIRRLLRWLLLPAATFVAVLAWAILALSLLGTSNHVLEWADSGPPEPTMLPNWVGEMPRQSVEVTWQWGTTCIAWKRGRLRGAPGNPIQQWFPSPRHPTIEDFNRSVNFSGWVILQTGKQNKYYEIVRPPYLIWTLASSGGPLRVMWRYALWPQQVGQPRVLFERWQSHVVFPNWPFAVGLTALCVWRWAIRIRRNHRRRRAQCLKCGYDLSATPPDLPCPECGAALPRERSDGGDGANEAARGGTDAA